jgi:chemotaxis protein CheX
MDVRHISAFLDATRAVFETMVKLPVTFEKPQLGTGRGNYDVSGVIGLSGDVVGSVIVGFSKESAAPIASALAGCPLEVGTPDFADAIGELSNMIAGGAKAKFEGQSVSIGCPSVVVAPCHQISSPSGAASICIACNTSVGRFVIDVTIQSSKKAAGARSATDSTSTKIPGTTRACA